jgi:hypothetical protein
MGYLATWLDWTSIDISEYAKETTTYSAYYYYWRDELFGRVMRLFKEKTDPIPPKEIEIRLMMQGHCGIAPYKGELTAFWGLPNGVSKYFDEKPFYTVRCPVYSANLKVGKDVEVIDNNILRNPLYDLIHHYATILAHTEVTYIMTAVEARNPKGVPVATTEKQKASIKSFLTKIFNGKFDTVTDIGNLGIQYVGAHTNVTQGVEELWNARERILASFLSDIGIKSGIDKRSNSVSDEINADTPSLLINLDDMLNSRKEGFERVNRHYGTNWTVELNDNIDYINMFTNPDTGKEQEDVQDN